MEDKNQGMFLTVWWGGIAIDSDWEKQMAMNYENRALLLLQPLLQLPQLSSFHLTEGPLGSHRWVRVLCVQASLENPRFSLSFVWHCFRVWKELLRPYNLRTPFPLNLLFPVPKMWPTLTSTLWLAGIMQEGSLQSLGKGDIGILPVVHQKSSADAERQGRSQWGHPHWSHLACTPQTCTQGCTATTLQSIRIWLTHLNL